MSPEASNDGGRSTVVVLVPFAGAGPSIFYSWDQFLPDGVEVRRVLLPGRERDLHKDPFLKVDDAASYLYAWLLERLPCRSDVFFFGHSLGAIIAYELSRYFERSILSPHRVRTLIVSGSAPPDCPRVTGADRIPDSSFLAHIEELAGYRDPALENPELCQLILPALRADVIMHESYVSYPPGLSADIVCVRGASDTLVDESSARGWSRFTGGNFEYHEVPEGHMYFLNDATRATSIINEQVRRWRRRRSQP